MNVPEELIESLLSWRRTVVVGHVTPDADCLGAMIALAQGFGEPGRRDLRMALPPGSLSLRLRFMMEEARPALAEAADFEQADGFVALDTAKISRCNVGPGVPESWAKGRTLLNIDHHASNTQFGQVNWVEPSASSTSEMVFDLLEAAERPVTPQMASFLYAGILTDCVGFTLSSTTPGSMEAAARLVARGADVAALGERLYRSLTPAEFQLLQVVYANTRTHADGRIAYSTAGHEEITRAGCTAADIDDQVNVPRSVQGICLALLLTEGVQGKTRINFRGESGLAVLDLAKSMGGGGHAEAAGAILDLPLEAAVPKVLAEATEYLDGHGKGSLS
jgi:phosphoesterase RecJ-like protein